MHLTQFVYSPLSDGSIPNVNIFIDFLTVGLSRKSYVVVDEGVNWIWCFFCLFVCEIPEEEKFESIIGGDSFQGIELERSF